MNAKLIKSGAKGKTLQITFLFGDRMMKLFAMTAAYYSMRKSCVDRKLLLLI